MSKFRRWIARILNKNQNTCWPELIKWAEGFYPFLEILNPKSNIYKQYCRAYNMHILYTRCGKCEMTDRFFLPQAKPMLILAPGYTKPGPAKRLARVLDRLFTQVQEWLEGPDSIRAKAIAYGILAVAAAYFAIHLFIFLKGIGW
ncbi:MAG TPA: hypothetical protein DCR95_04615 [Desulfobacter sp.]|nr:hypothetical protein [Desulfobacter sp.]